MVVANNPVTTTLATSPVSTQAARTAQAPNPAPSQAAVIPTPELAHVPDDAAASIGISGIDNTVVVAVVGGVGGIAATLFIVKLKRSRNMRIAPMSDPNATTGNLMRSPSRGSITIHINSGGMLFMDPSGQNGDGGGNRSIQIGMPVPMQSSGVMMPSVVMMPNGMIMQSSGMMMPGGMQDGMHMS
jgi:hypothetical protein